MDVPSSAVEGRVRRSYHAWLYLLVAVAFGIVGMQWAHIEHLNGQIATQRTALHIAVGLHNFVAEELQSERTRVESAFAQLAGLKREVTRLKMHEYIRTVTAPGQPCHQRDVQSTRIVDAVLRAATTTGLEPELILAKLRIESCLNPRAVSSSGARGLAQIVRSTAAELGLPWHRAFEIEPSVLFGAIYLKRQLDKTGNVYDALGRYNGWDDKQFPAKVLKVHAALLEQSL